MSENEEFTGFQEDSARVEGRRAAMVLFGVVFLGAIIGIVILLAMG